MHIRARFSLILLVLLVAFVGVGCSTKESIGPSLCYLTAVQFESTQITVTYSYDDSHRIISAKEVNGKTNTTLTSEYAYDNNNRVTSITYSNGEKDTYTYDTEGKVTSRTVTDNTGYGLIEIFTYNESNQLMRKENYSVVGAIKTLVLTTDYEYPNSSMRNPSLVTISVGSGASLTAVQTNEYTYDNKKTPESMTTFSPEATTNNVLEVTTTYIGEPAAITTYSYNYNTKGYPTRCVQTTESGSYTNTYSYFN